MRSTRASAAVERLKRRSGNSDFSMVRSANGLFTLAVVTDSGDMEQLNGIIWADPVPAGGTRVSFCLPAHRGEKILTPPKLSNEDIGPPDDRFDRPSINWS